VSGSATGSGKAVGQAGNVGEGVVRGAVYYQLGTHSVIVQ
jgi:hypothetical protein